MVGAFIVLFCWLVVNNAYQLYQLQTLQPRQEALDLLRLWRDIANVYFKVLQYQKYFTWHLSCTTKARNYWNYSLALFLTTMKGTGSQKEIKEDVPNPPKQASSFLKNAILFSIQNAPKSFTWSNIYNTFDLRSFKSCIQMFSDVFQ